MERTARIIALKSTKSFSVFKQQLRGVGILAVGGRGGGLSQQSELEVGGLSEQSELSGSGLSERSELCGNGLSERS